MNEIKNGKYLRSALLTILVVGVVTGANLWVHRGDLPVGYSEFSGNGFSFEYSEVLEVHSWGFPDGSAGANDFGGCVQVKRLWDGVWRNFWVIWYTDQDTPVLEDELVKFYASMDGWDLPTDNKGELFSSTKDGHEMLYQMYTFIEDGDLPYPDFTCAAGIWYEPWPSLHTNRVYVLTYIEFTELSSPGRVVDQFNVYLDSFNGNTRAQ